MPVAVRQEVRHLSVGRYAALKLVEPALHQYDITSPLLLFAVADLDHQEASAVGGDVVRARGGAEVLLRPSTA